MCTKQESWVKGNDHSSVFVLVDEGGSFFSQTKILPNIEGDDDSKGTKWMKLWQNIKLKLHWGGIRKKS